MPKKTVVGLDVGTNNLRAVEAIATGSGPKIIGVASIELPEGTVVGGEVRDIPAFSETLKTLWKSGKFSAKDVRIISNSEKNIAKLATMDDEVDFARILPFVLKQKSGIDTTKSYISYHTLRKFEVPEEDKSIVEGFRMVPKREIFLATTERTIVDSFIEAFSEANLRILSVDIAPLSIIRGDTDPTYNGPPEGIDTHVNIGGDLTTIVISNNGQPVFVRVIDVGGNDITNAIAEELDINESDAERLKIRTLTMNPRLLDRSLTQGTVFGADENEPEDEGVEEYSFNEMDAYDITNDELSSIITDISSTVLFFVDRNSMGLGKVKNRVYVSGGTAAFGKIRTHLAHEIGTMETINSRPFSNMEARKLMDSGLVQRFESIQHEYVIAVGAILGAGGESRD